MDAQSTGWIYVLRNPYMPGLVKIGFTSKQPAERAAELSNATGVPATYEVVFVASVHNAKMREVEQHLHKELDVHRINPLREFFMLSEDAAEELVKRSLKRIGIDNNLDFCFDSFSDGSGLEGLHPTGDRLLGVEDGREWPLNADKWQWESVLKYRRPNSPTDRSFCEHMKHVVGPDLKKPDSPEYFLGFYEGVGDRFDKEEQYIEERRQEEYDRSLYEDRYDDE